MNKHHFKLPLNGLRTFEAAARRLSFKEAAEELYVSPTTVSNQIRELEREWGCQLFIRKTRAVVLTDAGRSLSQVLGKAFTEIRAEIDQHITSAKKAVSLAVGPIFGSRWLSPRLARFHEAHPDIELILDHSPRITSVASLNSQIAIDWGTGDWDGVAVTRLFDISYSPVIHPQLCAQNGGLRRPADLAHFPIIHQRDRSEWTAWLECAELSELASQSDTIVMDSNIAVQAALDGQGVALGSFPFLENEVESGRLIKPFDIDLAPTRAYFLLVSHGARRTTEIDAVCRWIESEARETAV